MGGVHGVKESKELFELGFAVAQAVKVAGADGKFSLDDIGHFIATVPRILPALDGVSLVPGELAELDPDDEHALLEFAAEKLEVSISDETLRSKVYAYLHLAIALVAAVKATV